MPGGVSFSGALVRIALALVLVFATFNPTGYSLFHWITAAPVAVTPGKVLAVIALAIGWLICLRTAFIAMGMLGLALGVALFAVLVWFLVDHDLVSLSGSGHRLGGPDGDRAAARTRSVVVAAARPGHRTD